MSIYLLFWFFHRNTTPPSWNGAPRPFLVFVGFSPVSHFGGRQSWYGQTRNFAGRVCATACGLRCESHRGAFQDVLVVLRAWKRIVGNSSKKLRPNYGLHPSISRHQKDLLWKRLEGYLLRELAHCGQFPRTEQDFQYKSAQQYSDQKVNRIHQSKYLGYLKLYIWNYHFKRILMGDVLL